LFMVSSSSEDSLSSLTRASTERDGDGGRPVAAPGPAAAAGAALDAVYEAAADTGALKHIRIKDVIAHNTKVQYKHLFYAAKQSKRRPAVDHCKCRLKTEDSHFITLCSKRLTRLISVSIFTRHAAILSKLWLDISVRRSHD